MKCKDLNCSNLDTSSSNNNSGHNEKRVKPLHYRVYVKALYEKIK
jgi:hypothetical protein